MEKYIVEVSYFEFIFLNSQEALDFALKSFRHITEDKTVRIKIIKEDDTDEREA